MNPDKRRRWLKRVSLVNPDTDIPLYGYHRVTNRWRLSFPGGLSEHLVYFVVQSSCEAIMDGRRLRLDAGSFLWVPPGTSFRMRLVDGDRPITLYRFRWIARSRPRQRMEAIALDEAWELRPAMDALIAELAVPLPHRAARVRALLTVLLTSLFRLMDRAQSDHRFLTDSQRRAIERYADDHLHERISPDELAGVVDLSADYFTRLFRRTFGTAPRTWLVRRRIDRAALALDESGEPIGAIASQMGYDDVFLFSRQFKAVMGVSPRAYRNRR